jgi:hypothetical protein
MLSGVRILIVVGLVLAACGGPSKPPPASAPISNESADKPHEDEVLEAQPATATEEDQDPKMRLKKMFVEGQQAYEAGEFGKAATIFEAVYLEMPKPALLWNIAKARHMNGELSVALSVLQKMKGMQLEQTLRDSVDKLSQEIDAQLAAQTP